MNPWIELKPNDLKEAAEDQPVEGVRFALASSPYDIPIAVRSGFATESPHIFRIEFMYLTTERTRTESVDESTSVRLGIYSKRLYGINVDISSLSEGNSEFTINKAIARALLSSYKPGLSLDNAQLTQRALTLKRGDLLRGPMLGVHQPSASKA